MGGRERGSPRRRAGCGQLGEGPRALAAVLALFVASLLGASGASAETEAASEAPPGIPSGNEPNVGLDTLLKLPSDYSGSQRKRGGATAGEWGDRFDRAHGEVAEAQNALEQSQREMEHAAGDTSQWQVAAPGQPTTGENSPVSFGLRQQVRRHREEVAEAKRRLRALVVEADLAGVPPEWRGGAE